MIYDMKTIVMPFGTMISLYTGKIDQSIGRMKNIFSIFLRDL